METSNGPRQNGDAAAGRAPGAPSCSASLAPRSHVQNNNHHHHHQQQQQALQSPTAANAYRGPIAICGFGLRLPGSVSSGDDFWNLLAAKRDARAPVPPDRYRPAGFDGRFSDKKAIEPQQGYFLSHDVASVDSSFFSMTAEELAKSDPQQRQLLEVVRECLENAGEVDYRGKPIGCYVGTFGEDWIRMSAKDSQYAGRYSLMGHCDFVIANRISYEYDLCGPSILVKSGCSASMIALHEACSALRNDDCSAAIVAGTNLILGPSTTEEEGEEGILSPLGSCRTFDADADGFARGEAINAVYIKKLDDAIRDRNPIRAIIRNTAVNSDGRNVSLVQPNGESHVQLMRKIYDQAGLDPRATAFVECHGTGTPSGDPIETKAIGEVFGEDGVYITSVKPNLGHSEGASGLTSLIKAVLALEHKMIPPNIKFDSPNPKIPFDEKKLRVPVELTPWPNDRALRVSINSFGTGGTNAHVIVDSLSELTQDLNGFRYLPESSTALLVVSANTKASLEQHAGRIVDYANSNPEKVADLAYTLALRREHLAHRVFVLVNEDKSTSRSPIIKSPAQTPGITMVFSGQGAQWPRMGAELIQSDPKFREDIKAMDRIVQGFKHPPHWTIEDQLQAPPETSELSSAHAAQPICTALQIGIWHALSRCGVRVSAVVGHSSGEIAAAYAAGALSLRAALVIAYYRGFVTKRKFANGGMAAVGLGASQVAPYLGNRVVVACQNSEESTTISGDVEELDIALARIRDEMPETFCRKLKVDMAYHSHHMKPLAVEYLRLMEEEFNCDDRSLGNLNAAFFSTVTTHRMVDPQELGPQYWVSNLVSPVLFRSAVGNLLQHQAKDILLEIGPHSTLAGPLRKIASSTNVNPIYIPTMLRNADCMQTLLSAFGQLYQHGIAIDLAQLVPVGKVLTDLPTYSWDHSGENYWYEHVVTRNWRFRKFGHHSLLGLRLHETSDIEPCWRNVLSIDDEPWLADHQVEGQVIFPFAGYCAMAFEALRQMTGIESDFGVKHFVAWNALILPDSGEVEIRTVVHPCDHEEFTDAKSWKVTISSLTGDTWSLNCEGQIYLRSKELPPHPGLGGRFREVEIPAWYDGLHEFGFTYGPSFRCLSSVKASVNEHAATGIITLPNSPPISRFVVHPAAIDSCLQLATVALARGLGRHLARLSVPRMIGQIDITAIAPQMRAKAYSLDGGKSFTVDCFTLDKVVLRLTGLQLSRPDTDEGTSVQDHKSPAELVWRPHFDFVDHSTLFTPSLLFSEKARLQEEVGLLCALDSFERIEGLESNQPFMHKYKMWLGNRINEAKAGEYSIIDQPQRFTTLAKAKRQELIHEKTAELYSISPNDTIMDAIHRVWNSTERTYEGKEFILNILMQDELLLNIYNETSFNHADFLQSFSHTKPDLRILEVGAGTGGTTQSFLKDLVDIGGLPMYKLYTFTDITDGFFIKAKHRFSYAPNMEFKVLDISRDPLEQGFEPETYDLILAANVVHATPFLKVTLGNLRKLLSKEGRLVLTELTTKKQTMSYIFGTVPGWWLGEEDGRVEQPHVSVDRWDQELRASGFTGVDAAVYDTELPYHDCAVMVSQPKIEMNDRVSKITVLWDDSRKDYSGALTGALAKSGWLIDYCKIGEALPRDQLILSALDLGESFFENITEGRYSALQTSMRSITSQKMLWLTDPSQRSSETSRGAQSLGVIRTMRAELEIDVYTFEIGLQETDSEHIVMKMLKWIEKSEDVNNLRPDREFTLLDGQVQVGRYLPFSFEERRNNPRNIDPADVKTFAMNANGPISNWTSEKSSTELPPDSVEIEVHVCGIDFTARSQPRGTAASGVYFSANAHELAGRVTRIGSAVQNMSSGDRVIALWHQGQLTTRAVVPAGLVTRIPNNLTYEEIATLSISFVTAFYSLIEVGRLKVKNSVLIHLAASALGQAAIQICQQLGAVVYVTVEKDDEARYLRENFGLPSDNIFEADEETYPLKIMQSTGKNGVDIVLGSPCKDFVRSSCTCIAEFGTLIDLGAGDLSSLDRVDLGLFLSNRSFSNVNIASMMRNRPAETKSILETYIDWLQQKKIYSTPRTASVAASEIDKDFQFHEALDGKDKVLIHMTQGDMAMNAVPKQQKLSLDLNAIYLISGHLDNVGKSLILWLAERGARSFVIVSPSASAADDTGPFLADLASLGCSASTVGDSLESLQDTIQTASTTGQPIRGVIHLGATVENSSSHGGQRAVPGVNQATPFLETTYPDWMAATEPTINGVWNLHQALADEALDFFLVASSLFTTVGRAGQAIKSAIDTFLEDLCQHRRRLGLPAAVLSLPAAGASDILGADQKTKPVAKARALSPFDEQAFMDAVELSILSPSYKPDIAPSTSSSAWTTPGHIYVGLEPQKPQKSIGVLPDRHDRRVAIYYNTRSFASVGETKDSSQLEQLISSAREDPSIMADGTNVDLLAYEIGKKAMEVRLRSDEDIDVSMSLLQLGMDSLKAVDMRKWWKRMLGLEVSTFELMKPQPLKELAWATAKMIQGTMERGDGA